MSFIEINKPNAGDAISKTTFADAVIDNLAYLRGAIEEADVVLPSPSFETFTTVTLPDTTTIDRPINWALGDPQVLHGDYEVTSEDAHHGSRSLKLTGDPDNSATSGDRTELYSDFFQVEESENYSVRWAEKRTPVENANALPTDAQVFIEFYSSTEPGATMLRSVELTNGATDAVGVTFVRRTPKGVTTSNLEYFARFVIKGPSNDGAVFFDDFRMAIAGEITTQTLNANDATFNTVTVNGTAGETSVTVVGDIDASKTIKAGEKVESPSIVAGGGAAQVGMELSVNGDAGITGKLTVQSGGLSVTGSSDFAGTTFSAIPSGAGFSSFLHYHNNVVSNYDQRIDNYKTTYHLLPPFIRYEVVNDYTKLVEISPGQGTYLVLANAQYYKQDDNASAYLYLAVDGSIQGWGSVGALNTYVTSVNLQNIGILTIGNSAKIQAYGKLSSSLATFARVDTRMWLIKVGN